MQKINFSPVATSRNFGMNYLAIDDELTDIPVSTFDNITLSKGDYQLLSTGAMTPPNAILQQHANYTKKLIFNQSTKAPVVVEFNFDARNNTLVDILNIVLKPKVKAQIILKYTGQKKSYHNGMLYLDLQKDSQLDIIIYSNISGNNFLSIYDQKEQNATLNYTLVDFATNITAHNIKSCNIGSNTSTTLNSMYFGTNSAMLDLNYWAVLSQPKSKTKLNTIGALLDNAQKNYKGTIDFQKGAKKSVGDESEYCMFLSSKAKSKALPMLLCGEEDVKGSHASSAGKIDTQALFYITSRGLTPAEALKLLVKARLSAITNNIFDSKLKDEIFKQIDRRLNSEIK